MIQHGIESTLEPNLVMADWHTVQGLLQHSSKDLNHTACCNQYATLLKTKLLRSGLHICVDAYPHDTPLAICLSNLYEYYFSACGSQVPRKDPWKGEIHHLCSQPWPSWLIKTAIVWLADWARGVVNASLRVGVVPLILREAVITPQWSMP